MEVKDEMKRISIMTGPLGEHEIWVDMYGIGTMSIIKSFKSWNLDRAVKFAWKYAAENDLRYIH